MTEDSIFNFIRDGGAVAIGIYLVWWITRKLNGKFDRLAESVEKLNASIETLVKTVTDTTNK